MKRSIVIRFGIAAAGLALLTSCGDTPSPAPIPPPVAEAAPPPVEVTKVSVAVRPPPLPMAARRESVAAVAASAPPRGWCGLPGYGRRGWSTGTRGGL
jgi:hypothetical protein